MQQDLQENPFRPISTEQLVDSSWQMQVDFVPIMRRWENFRLVYNGVLIPYTILWACFQLPHLVLDPLFLFQLGFGGFITNLCFFTGPAIEAYGSYFGFWNRTCSILLFLAGLSFTGLLATGFLIARGF